ncbi:hypothetical protein BGZ52_006059 [Haplosporangium bisporale]|nr:hypothetical protein BGZ52_006059 [Haplosporangium bisporale]KAI9234968.1 MAG: hypothetical protein BYD32DRAFT_438753 [Podila humilis]
MALRFAEGFVKPRASRQFANSAKKRASIRALGSITYLQQFYASGGAMGEGFLNLEDLSSKKSFVDTIGPRSKLVSPEVLLRYCHEDIQTVLEVWGIISYPTPFAHRGNGQEQVLDSPISVDDDSRQLGHGKEGSSSSLNTQQQRRYDSVSIDLLALLESSTKVIQSVRQYSMHAPVLTPEALTIHRQAALSVIEMLSILEQTNRLNDDDSDSGYPEGYCYARLNFGDLEEERAEMKNYLTVVQEQLFRPQVEKLETQLGQLLIDPTLQVDVANGNVPEGYTNKDPSLPKWLDDDEWTKEDGEGISLQRCHAFLQFFRPLTRDSIPSPATNMTGFLDALSDGYILCKVFNTFIRLTNMPFGIVDKIHEDTNRTWRGADNWRFLIQACKFRLEFKIPDGSFKPIEIVRQSELGREQLQAWVKLIIERGIQEAKDTLEAQTKDIPPASPVLNLNF